MSPARISVIASTNERVTVVALPDSTPITVVAVGRGAQGVPGADGPPGASVAAYTATTALSGHIAVTLDTTGSAVAASADNAAHRVVSGVTLNAAIAGDAVQAMTVGAIEHLGWTFTPGLPVFLGLNGALTQTLPPTAVFSKVLGVAVTPTRISLDFQPAIFLT